MYNNRRTCFNKAVLVDGMLLIILPLQNKYFLHSFVVRQFNIRLYKRQFDIRLYKRQFDIRLYKRQLDVRLYKRQLDVPLYKSPVNL